MLVKQHSKIPTGIPRRGFLDGLACVIDLGANYTRSLDYRCRVLRLNLGSDAQALGSDWLKVGQDLNSAISQYDSGWHQK